MDVGKLIEREGGFSNNPLDHGGATKYGITQQTLSWYRKGPVTVEDVRNLSLEEAKAIYNKRYVDGPGFDKVPQGMVQSNLVDFGVMSGPHIAISNLQEALQVEVDGVLGPKTLAALAQSDLTALNISLCKKRCLMAARLCKKDPSQLAFLLGWLQRFFSFI